MKGANISKKKKKVLLILFLLFNCFKLSIIKDIWKFLSYKLKLFV